MAREHDGEQQAQQNRSESLLQRRSYLKMAGSAVATLAAAGAASGSAAAARTADVSEGDDISAVLEGIGDGETVRLPTGTYSLSDDVSIDADDWTFDGRGATIETTGRIELIVSGSGWDFGYLNIEPQNGSAPNDWCQVRMTGGEGWRFHNVAWTRTNRTQYTSGNNRRMSCILPGVDKGGEAAIEDCWFGEGCDPEHGTSAIATWGTCDGTLWIRRSYFYRSGVYGANSSTDYVRNEGVTHFEDCYFQDCYIHCMRTGSHFEPAHIRRCVATISDRENIPTREGIDGHYSRGIYAYHGPVIVEDTHLDMAEERAIDVSEQHDIRRQPTVEMTGGALAGRVKNAEYVTFGSDVGDSPKSTPPSACVTSAREAYGGSSGSSSSGSSDGGSADTPAYEHTLTIEGRGQATNYAFSVSDSLVPVDDSTEQWDEVTDSSVEGWVTSEGSVDEFGFDGEVTAFEFVQGEATLLLDGAEVTPEELTSAGYDHTLTIRGTGEATNYAFAVSEELVGVDDSIEQWDDVSKTEASGWVTSSSNEDRYEFDGELTTFEFTQGEATLLLDGEEVSPESIGAPTTHALTIRGTGEATNYAFAVSEELVGVDDSIEQWDDVSKTEASGWVTSSSNEDRYEFTGEVTTFEFTQGEATLLLDGDETSPTALGE